MGWTGEEPPPEVATRPEAPAAADEGRPPAPTGLGERLTALDFLRGVAVLGIFVINLPLIALPEGRGAVPDPAVDSRADILAWMVSHVAFEQKMVSLFSILFGAGIWLMTERVAARGLSPRRFHYRRMAWLLLFGLGHAYFIWSGDILFLYAVIGMLVYPFRRMRPRRLAPLVAGLVLLSGAAWAGLGVMVDFVREKALEARSLRLAVEVPDEPGTWEEIWDQIGSQLEPDSTAYREALAVKRGGYWGMFATRAQSAVGGQVFTLLYLGVWQLGALMLLGVALLRSGILSGARSRRFYAALAVGGYLVGGAFGAWGTSAIVQHRFDLLHVVRVGMPLLFASSIPTALGHAGALLLIWKRAPDSAPVRWLRATGRMAFTNYILQSIVATFLFQGWGLGLWDRLARVELVGVIIAVWAAQVAGSVWWLRRYRFGPLEWVWRGLTYGSRPPWRISEPTAGPS